MKTKTVKYTDDHGQIAGKLRRLTPNAEAALGLPTPAELADKVPQTKITLAVDDDALAFFKTEAEKHGTSYQPMMRKLLTAYARQASSADLRPNLHQKGARD